ncbi:glycosyltransferase family 4 protein [Kocuria salsicia]|uniref:glycosyltransferase family 4 protein n=1 Tax=Kocuria salsicia TaxID=664639 RepID=UPI00340345D0
MSLERTGRCLELAANAWLTTGTVARHVTDDPVVFWLQVSRRLPRRWVTPAARCLRHAPGSTPRATALHLLGHDDAARTVLAEESSGARGTRRGAEVALALGDTDLAARLLDSVPEGTPGTAATRARLAWHRGEVDHAVALLDAARSRGTATRGERSLHCRLAAERDLLGDFLPRLDPVTGYTPRERTVLYAVTNSLPHTASGYAQRSHSYLTALQEEGWHVHAVTRPGYPVQVGKILARHTDVVDGIPYHRILPAGLASTATGRVQQHADALLALALELRPAVLHTTSHYVNALAVAAVARTLGIPWVYEVRGLLADTWAATRGEQAVSSPYYERFQRREAWAATSADRTVTLGTAMAGRLIDLAADYATDDAVDTPRGRGTAAHGVAGAPLHVDLAPNAVGGALLDAPSRDTARVTLGLPADRFLVGTVTSVVDYEGIDDLLGAAALLRSRIPQLRVLVVGDGVARPALEHLAHDLGIEDIVTFTGRVPREHAATWTAALDTFVIPRKDRSVTRAVTPLKPVEAMAAGTPVIASDLPALRETVRDGETGLLTPPEDPDALANTIARLARDPGEAADLALTARAWVREHRTWAAIAQQASTRYCELTGDIPTTAHEPQETDA